MWSENGTEIGRYLANAIRTGRSNINTCKTIDKTNNHTSDKEIENGD